MTNPFGAEGAEPDWDGLAQLPGLAAVIDPSDKVGAKNLTIDRLHKHALARSLGPLAGQHILDYGCGIGRISSWLTDSGATVHGVDASPEMLSRAQESTPDARFTLTAPDGVPSDVASPFDAIVAVYVFQYLVIDPDRLTRLLRDVSPLLRPNGRIAALEQVHDGGLDRGGALADYEAAFRAAGLTIYERRAVRVSGSRILGLVMRWPWLARLSILPPCVEFEARFRRAPLLAGRYADYVLMARQQE